MKIDSFFVPLLPFLPHHFSGMHLFTAVIKKNSRNTDYLLCFIVALSSVFFSSFLIELGKYQTFSSFIYLVSFVKKVVVDNYFFCYKGSQVQFPHWKKKGFCLRFQSVADSHFPTSCAVDLSVRTTLRLSKIEGISVSSAVVRI